VKNPLGRIFGDIKQGMPVFCAGYIKRMLEGKYDKLINETKLGRTLKGAGLPAKFGMEGFLNISSAFADSELPENSFWKKMAKEVITDAGPEIAKRIINGDKISETDPNGLVTSYRYNGFGTLFETIMPNGTIARTTKHWAITEDGDPIHTNVPESAIYFISRSKSGQPNVFEYYNLANQKLREVSIAYDGATIFKDYIYNELSKMGICYVASAANFILVDAGRDSLEIFKSMLKFGVIVRDMKQYGLDNFIRVTIGTKEENKRFVRVLSKVLKEKTK